MRETEARFLLVASLLVSSWLGYQLICTAGTLAHGWYSGGTVHYLAVSWLGVARVEIFPCPDPRFVAWGGILWSALLPLALLALGRVWLPRYDYLLAFFAGFALLATATRLIFGSILSRGAAGELVRLGVQNWLLVSFGLLLALVGFSLWNSLGGYSGLGQQTQAVDRRAIYGTSLLAGMFLLVMLWIANN